MDLAMPGINGIEATRRIVQAHPQIRILVVTLFEDGDSVFAALRAGARGYILKDANEVEVLRAIRAVSSGDAIFSHRHPRLSCDDRAWHWVIRTYCKQDLLAATTRTRIIGRVTDSIFSSQGSTKTIIAEWTDPRTQTTYQFRSFVPTSVPVKLGESVDVLIDPDHPEGYTVMSVASINMKKR